MNISRIFSTSNFSTADRRALYVYFLLPSLFAFYFGAIC